MNASKKPPPPRGSHTAGRQLWLSVVENFDLEGHETELLTRACACADRIAILDGIISREGVMLRSTEGGVRTHPAVVEARLQTTQLSRLLAALRLPADADDAGSRPQHRGPRGPYTMREVS